MKTNFRGRQIDLIKVYKYWDGVPQTIASDYEKLNQHEKLVATALVVETELQTIADGLIVAAKTEIMNLEEVMEMAVENTGLDTCELLMPLFFSYDLKSAKSNFLPEKKVRDCAFNEFKKIIKRNGKNIVQLKKDYMTYHYEEECYFSVKDDFLKICEVENITKKITDETTRLEVYEEIKIKIWDLFGGLVIGAFFGPLGYIHANADTGSVKSAKEEWHDEVAKPWMNIGVTFSCFGWGIIVFT